MIDYKLLVTYGLYKVAGDISYSLHPLFEQLVMSTAVKL